MKVHVKEALGKKEAQEIRDIQNGPLFKGLLLNKRMFDKIGNRIGTKDKYPTGYWGDPSKTYTYGPKGDQQTYNPPYQWIGYGLKVKNGNWLSSTGWWNAYHGVGCPANDCSGGKKVIGAIATEGFKPGSGQAYSGYPDSRPKHAGQNCGTGVYFSPDPNVADSYAGSGFGYNGNNYKIGFKVRINPDTVTQAFMIFVISFLLMLLGAIVLWTATPVPPEFADNPKVWFSFSEYMVECASAFGTVGLSAGITAATKWWGLLYLVLLMFVGQLGVINTLLSWTRFHPHFNDIEYPYEDIKIG